ncbi:MAG: ankyrin repeat domain-containing protein [Pseudomonadota bacterium]
MTESFSTEALPASPNLAQLKTQAKELLKRVRAGDREAQTILKSHAKFAHLSEDDASALSTAGLQDMQHVLALHYGFPHWQALLGLFDHNDAVRAYERLRADGRRFLAAYKRGDPAALEMERVAMSREEVRVDLFADLSDWREPENAPRSALIIVAADQSVERWYDLVLAPVNDSKRLLEVDHPFVLAVRKRDLKMVEQQLVADPALVDARILGDCQLNGSIRNGIEEEIITAKAGDQRTTTALHFAVIRGEAELTKLLLSAGADVHGLAYHSYNVYYPLELAAWQGTVETARVLIDAGADLNLCPKSVWTALTHNREDIAHLMLERGAVHTLETAILLGDVSIIAAHLEDNPASLATEALDGRFPIDHAIEESRFETARSLLDLGSPVTPIAAAAFGMNTELTQFINDDPELLTRNDDLMTYAMIGNQREAVDILRQHGATVPAPTKVTSILYRIYDWRNNPAPTPVGQDVMFHILLDMGADPWDMAAPCLRAGLLDQLHLLAEHGLDFTACNDKGESWLTSLLLWCSMNRHDPDHIARSVQFFYDQGLDFSAIPDDGRSLLDRALDPDSLMHRVDGYQKVIELIRDLSEKSANN